MQLHNLMFRVETGVAKLWVQIARLSRSITSECDVQAARHSGRFDLRFAGQGRCPVGTRKDLDRMRRRLRWAVSGTAEVRERCAMVALSKLEHGDVLLGDVRNVVRLHMTWTAFCWVACEWTSQDG